MTAYFPIVRITRNGAGHEALAGLAMRAILRADLLDGAGARTDKGGIAEANRGQQLLQTQREALLHALAGLAPGLTLELHFDARPELADIAKSRLHVTLFLRCRGHEAGGIREQILAGYLALRPLLASHLAEAEFVPIIDLEELQEKWQGHGPRCAAAIRRRRETLTLEAPLRKAAIGFESRPQPEKFAATVRHVYPWTASLDSWANLMNTLLFQLDPVKLIVRLTPCRLGKQFRARLTEAITVCDHFLAAPREDNTTLGRQAEQARQVSLRQLAGLAETGFRLGVMLLAAQPVDPAMANILGKAITGLQSEGKDNGPSLQGGFEVRKISALAARRLDYHPDREPHTLAEAACAFRLPSPPVTEIPGLPVSRSRTGLALLPSLAGRNDAVTLAINDHRGLRQEIRLTIDDRMRHLAVFGQTGCGKTTFLKNLILQDVRAGRGFALLDPHGDLVDEIIGKIPAERLDDVILFDFLERQWPMGFNFLEWRDIEERDLIIDDLYLTLDRLYDMRQTGGPIFESNFRGMLKLLMGDRRRSGFVPTILDFSRCYLDRDFRHWLKESVKDPTTLDFLQELERTGGEASLNNLSPYVTSKFGRFVHDRTLRRIVGQEKTAIDFEAIMNQGKILLVKLGKGRFGGGVGGLLVNQIVSRFKLAAMKRGETRSEARREFFLYVDEAHNLPPENFVELLAEARKYRMGLVLATQYTAQLAGTGNTRTDLLSAITGNVGTTIAFRLGKDDAEKLAPVFYPSFHAGDIIGLPNWHGYMSTAMGGATIPPFSFRGIQDETVFDTKIARHIVEISRGTYGREASEVDREIEARRRYGGVSAR